MSFTAESAHSHKLPEGQVVLVLVGLIGSGKSTFAQALQDFFPIFRRCNQDELGNRRAVEGLARSSLRDGQSVCIDRTNFDASQRATWINIAREFPGTKVWVIVFDVPYDVCARRIQLRRDHPTITTPEQGISVLNRFQSQYQPPQPSEGYDHIIYLRPTDQPSNGYTLDSTGAILRRIHTSAQVERGAPTAPLGGTWRTRGPSGNSNHKDHNTNHRGRQFHIRGMHSSQRGRDVGGTWNNQWRDAHHNQGRDRSRSDNNWRRVRDGNLDNMDSADRGER